MTWTPDWFFADAGIYMQYFLSCVTPREHETQTGNGQNGRKEVDDCKPTE